MTSTAHGSPPPVPPASAPGTAAPGGAAPGRTAFWDWLLRTGVRRSDDRWAGGVASGLAVRLGVDPLLLRVVVVVVSLVGGAGLLLYAAAWLLVPDVRGRIEARSVVAGDVSAAAVVALGLLALAVIVPAPWSWAFTGPVVSGGDVAGLVLVALVLAAAVALLPRLVPASAGGARSDGAPVDVGGSWTASRGRSPRRRRLPLGAVSAVLGLALLVGAGTWLLLGRSGARRALGLAWTPQLSGPQALGLALVAGAAVLGVALVACGLAGRRSDGLGFWAVSAAVVAVLAVSSPSGAAVRAVGDAAWRPTSVAAAERGYASWAGDAVLDLRALPGAEAGAGGTVEVPLRHGFGTVRVVVPRDARVEVRTRLGAGDVSTTGPGWDVRGQRGGLLPDTTATAGPATAALRVVLDLQGLAGDVDLVRSAA